MDPVVVNGLIALTGIAAGVATGYVEGDVQLAMAGYVILVFGYLKQRFGDEKKKRV